MFLMRIIRILVCVFILYRPYLALRGALLTVKKCVCVYVCLRSFTAVKRKNEKQTHLQYHSSPKNDVGLRFLFPVFFSAIEGSNSGEFVSRSGNPFSFFVCLVESTH